MTMRALRLGVSGCGRVFERLYLPALRSVPGLLFMAVADPAGVREGVRLPGSLRFSSMDEMLDGVELDAIAVLSPPALHAAHAATAMARGLPVLLEKPPALSLAEVDNWPEAARELLTPAFPRRWWPAYRHLREEAQGAEFVTLGIRADPGEWSAYEGAGASVAEDLLPHAADLTRWLTGQEIEDVEARGGPNAARVTLALRGSGCVECFLSHRGPYREAARVAGRLVHVGPSSVGASAWRRLQRRPDADVEATAAMLKAWLRRMSGEAVEDLPALADARAVVAVMEAAREQLTAGQAGVA